MLSQHQPELQLLYVPQAETVSEAEQPAVLVSESLIDTVHLVPDVLLREQRLLLLPVLQTVFVEEAEAAAVRAGRSMNLTVQPLPSVWLQ